MGDTSPNSGSTDEKGAQVIESPSQKYLRECMDLIELQDTKTRLLSIARDVDNVKIVEGARAMKPLLERRNKCMEIIQFNSRTPARGKEYEKELAERYSEEQKARQELQQINRDLYNYECVSRQCYKNLIAQRNLIDEQVDAISSAIQRLMTEPRAPSDVVPPLPIDPKYLPGIEARKKNIEAQIVTKTQLLEAALRDLETMDGILERAEEFIQAKYTHWRGVYAASVSAAAITSTTKGHASAKKQQQVDSTENKQREEDDNDDKNNKAASARELRQARAESSRGSRGRRVGRGGVRGRRGGGGRGRSTKKQKTRDGDGDDDGSGGSAAAAVTTPTTGKITAKKARLASDSRCSPELYRLSVKYANKLRRSLPRDTVKQRIASIVKIIKTEMKKAAKLGHSIYCSMTLGGCGTFQREIIHATKSLKIDSPELSYPVAVAGGGAPLQPPLVNTEQKDKTVVNATTTTTTTSVNQSMIIENVNTIQKTNDQAGVLGGASPLGDSPLVIVEPQCEIDPAMIRSILRRMRPEDKDFLGHDYELSPPEAMVITALSLPSPVALQATPPARKNLHKVLDKEYQQRQRLDAWETELATVIPYGQVNRDPYPSAAAHDFRLAAIDIHNFISPIVDEALPLPKSSNALVVRNQQKFVKPIKVTLCNLLNRSEEGLFRRWCVGRLVGSSFRAVLNCDSDIKTSEIGIGSGLARKLYEPIEVTELNIAEIHKRVDVIYERRKRLFARIEEKKKNSLRSEADIANLNASGVRVANAPSLEALLPDREFSPEDFQCQDVYPAVRMIYQQGTSSPLYTKSLEEPYSNRIKVGDKVEFNIGDGSILLINRQPTLHRWNILAFIVRIRGTNLCIHMNPDDVTSFNADFDGDTLTGKGTSHSFFLTLCMI